MNRAFMQPTVRGILHELVELKKSKIQGKGLFALQDIEQEKMLHNTHVNIKGHGWANVRPNNLCNHSKINENCEIRTEDNTKVLYTIRHIQKGEELLVDYTKDQEVGFEQPKETWAK